MNFIFQLIVAAAAFVECHTREECLGGCLGVSMEIHPRYACAVLKYREYTKTGDVWQREVCRCGWVWLHVLCAPPTCPDCSITRTGDGGLINWQYATNYFHRQDTTIT
ncbi:hypothetical protein L0F63_004326, partial [Massospora cicadina]